MSAAPRVQIISTGSEILQGLYADTNAQRLSRRFLDNGFEVIGHSAVPDDRALIREVLDRCCRGCELIVMTGGLGPTGDDVNRFVISDLWARPLARDFRVEEMIRERFAGRGIAMPRGNEVQADLPQGALPLYNYWGTAPGFILPSDGTRPVLAALPGPPGEWQPMLDAALRAELSTLFPARQPRVVQSLHIAMTPESIIGDALRGIIGRHEDGHEVTILAARGHIRIRVMTTGADRDAALGAGRPILEEIRKRIGNEIVFSDDTEDASLAETVVHLLIERRESLVLAESCTGGWISKAVTDVPGSSAVLLAGYATYSNAAKAKDLDVPNSLIDTEGAVSEPVVRAMAEGARRRTGATWSLAVSGVAGPDGGTVEKPTGTVWFALAGPTGTVTRRRRFSGGRETVRELAVNQGLELIRRSALQIDLDAMILPPHSAARP